ncbi:Protein fem-1-like protein C-like, partial [Oopsacas minuta]
DLQFIFWSCNTGFIRYATPLQSYWEDLIQIIGDNFMDTLLEILLDNVYPCDVIDFNNTIAQCRLRQDIQVPSSITLPITVSYGAYGYALLAKKSAYTLKPTTSNISPLLGSTEVTYGKADISQTTAAGIDLLHIAIERKSQKIFNLLIQLGAKIIWPCRGQTPSPPTPYYTVPDVYQPPSHIFVAAKCHNDYAIDYLSKQPKYLHEYEADVLLVRGIGRVFDDDAFQVTEVWKEALGFREKHNLDYPGKPALDLYEGVQEVKTLRDIDNLSEKRDLIHCVLISERIFGPLYYTSCEFKIQLINCLYSEGPVNHWRCCELLYQLLQALVKRNWKPPTQQSINQFNTLLYHVNKQLPAYDNTVITMEKFAAYFKCIYTSYASLLERIELNMNVSYQECLNQLLAFLNIWFQKFPSFTTLESVVHRNPLIVEALQLLFHPLTRDETIFHSIMKSENFLKNENVLNTFIAVSTPDMLEVSDKDGLTALHFACTLETVPDSLIPSLIEAGSHIDSVTSSKRTPIESCISELSPQYLALISFYPLKLVCLSARIIVQYQLSTDKLPGFFETFINLHRTPNSKGED